MKTCPHRYPTMKLILTKEILVMKNYSRQILISALIVIFLNTACGSLTRNTPDPVGTILANNPSQTVTATLQVQDAASLTSTPVTPVIPITGENVVSMQCQFCVDTVAHAVLIFPEFAFFDVVTTAPVTCLTAQIVNGQRILICRGAELTSFTLNICSDPSNCLNFPVALQACPLIPNTGIGTGTPRVTFTPATPYFLNPINTLIAPTSTRRSKPTLTGVPSLAPSQTIVAPPPATPTFVVPTTTPVPPPTETSPPPPTTEEPTTPQPPPPGDTATEDGGSNKKATKTPKPN